MQACSMLANVVMIIWFKIYEEKRENDWRLDIKALLTGTGYIIINSTTKENIEMTYSVV
jgi:hypothetical protein